ncbi:MAG: hypothetical protein ACUVUF_07855 [Candidatus Bathycorpusculaceae bacterium]
MNEKRVKTKYLDVFKELKDKAVNLRSCEFLFSVFLKSYPKMKLSWDDDWGKWTSNILTFFAELGKFYGYQIYLKPEYGVLNLGNEPSTEYLVDLCWCLEDEYERAYWMEIALESELSSQDIDSIKYDFWKLTDVKAYTKVAVFAPRLRDRQIVLEELVALVAHHEIRVPEEKYLIILILNYGKAEDASKRIEIAGYEINYLGDLKPIDSKRFPAKLS